MVERDSMRDVLVGPAVITEYSATTWVPPGWRVQVLGTDMQTPRGRGQLRMWGEQQQPVVRRGQKVRRFKVYRCRDFRELTLPESGGAY